MNNVDDEEFALVVRELYKFYGNCGAVKNLTFGIDKKDCFGLLGNFSLFIKSALIL